MRRRQKRQSFGLPWRLGALAVQSCVKLPGPHAPPPMWEDRRDRATAAREGARMATTGTTTPKHPQIDPQDWSTVQPRVDELLAATLTQESTPSWLREWSDLAAI